MEKGAIFYVYEHWRPDTGQCFYVGKGHGPRAYDLSNRNDHHKGIQQKLKDAGREIEVRLIQERLSENAAFDLEIARIALWRARENVLANHTPGGEGRKGYRPSPETRARMSAAQRGRRHSAETREKLRVSHLGKRPSAETRMKQSAVRTGRSMPREGVEKARKARVGKRRTDEQRANMRAGFTVEARALISKSTSAANKRRVGMKYKKRECV